MSVSESALSRGSLSEKLLCSGFFGPILRRDRGLSIFGVANGHAGLSEDSFDICLVKMRRVVFVIVESSRATFIARRQACSRADIVKTDRWLPRVIGLDSTLLLELVSELWQPRSTAKTSLTAYHGLIKMWYIGWLTRRPHGSLIVNGGALVSRECWSSTLRLEAMGMIPLFVVYGP